MKTRHLVYLAFALLGLGLAGLLEDWGLLPQSPSLLSSTGSTWPWRASSPASSWGQGWRGRWKPA